MWCGQLFGLLISVLNLRNGASYGQGTHDFLAGVGKTGIVPALILWGKEWAELAFVMGEHTHPH